MAPRKKAAAHGIEARLSALRGDFEALQADLLFAGLAETERPFVNSDEGFFDLLEIEGLAITEAHAHRLLDVGRRLIDLVETIVGVHAELLAHDLIAEEEFPLFGDEHLLEAIQRFFSHGFSPPFSSRITHWVTA